MKTKEQIETAVLEALGKVEAGLSTEDLAQEVGIGAFELEINLLEMRDKYQVDATWNGYLARWSKWWLIKLSMPPKAMPDRSYGGDL